MKKYLLGILFIATLVPQTVAAYKFLDSSATKLNKSTVLFTITYQLGYGKYGIEAPVGAIEGNSTSSAYITYGIYNEDEARITKGKFSSVVLSEASYREAQYILAEREVEQFKLVVLYTAPDGVNADDYFLRVNSLPFTLTYADKKFPNGLSSGEIKSYVTPKTGTPGA